MEHKQIYPREGWCEHDPEEIINNVKECIEETLKKLEAAGYSKKDLVSVGVTNQRETTIVWDKETGKPLYNAVVWLDLRTSGLVEELSRDYGSDRFRDVTGLPVSTYFSGVKLLWLERHVPEVAAAISEGRALFGTIDTWIIYRLSGGAQDGGVHVTDVTNASRTMLMDLNTCTWHEPTCSALGITTSMLPEIRSCSEVYAPLRCTSLKGVPIAGCAGDQHAAMLGQLAFKKGQAKCTYGTGAFMLMNVGDKPVKSTHGLLSTVCYKLGPNAPVTYALEGSVAVAGRAVMWLRDNMEMVADAKELQELASSVSSSEGVYFVPAFSGLFAPYWRPDARGCIVGLTLYSTKAHIARATLDAVAFQARELLDAMESDSNTKMRVLKVDGGMTINELMMSIQADAIQTVVLRPKQIETTALGAALAAGLATGVWESVEQVEHLNPTGKTFAPVISEAESNKRLRKWRDAVQRTLNLA